MNKKRIKRIIIFTAGPLLALGILVFSLSGTVEAKGPRGNGNTTAQNSGQSGFGVGFTSGGVATTPLNDEEQSGLQQAILEEYKAMNLYQTVVDQLGSIAPFNAIVKSEQQHVNALINQATKYGVEIPVNPGMDSAVSFDSISEACVTGVSVETEDAALYDDLMAVTTHSDLLRVYTTLQNASINYHLPAFELCD